MAETSGFFQGLWDESLTNPITKEDTGWWDRSYLAKEFMEYFALFVGNGVFVSPTNQLKVLAGQGNTVIIKQGWAFINGAFYHNDDDLILSYPVNNGVTPRRDTIRLRFSNADRNIKAYVFAGDTDIVRGENTYDLILAQTYVPAGAATIIDANIEDKRPDESVCGFVKGLLSVISTDDLFAQFTSMFNEWFDTVKDQVTGDLAIRLQQEFEEINAKFEQYQKDVLKIANDSKEEIENFVAKYFVLPNTGNMTLTFVNKQCIINDERITDDSLIDVYFDSETIQEAEDCQIYVDSYEGQIVVSATKQPAFSLKASIGVRIR